jgi:putative sigma-54 modulation protein
MTNIVTKGIHVTVTEAISNHIQDQFSLITDHYESFITKDLEVSLDVDSKHTQNIHIVKASIPIKGKNIFVEDSGNDMYKTISNVVSKANSQLKKLKTKKNQRINKRDLFIEVEVEDNID